MSKSSKTPKTPQETQDQVKSLILQAANKNKVEPRQITSAQFWSIASGKITEWEVRKNGGLSNIKDALFPPPPEIISLPPKPKKFKVKFPKIENFTVHGVDIKTLFKKAKLKQNEVFKLIVQPDTHCPEHDPAAVNAFCKFLKYYKPHGLINLGDFLEMKGVSHWAPIDPKPKRLIPEIKVGKSVLQRIDIAAGVQCRFKRFITGNHEYWLEQYLNLNCSEIFDGIEDLGIDLSVEGFLGLKKLGYETIPFNEILAVGEANFIHGMYTGKHHASKHLDVFQANIYYGHVHDVQGHSAVNIRALHEAKSLGCLRTLNAPFLKGKPNNWAHSWGIFEFMADGTYTRYEPILVNGRLSYNGIIFDGNTELETYL